MIVRGARPPDARAIARVHVDSWRTTYRGIVPDDYLAALSYKARECYWSRVLENASPEFVYVAEGQSGEVVGFAAAGPLRTTDSSFTGELYAIYLLEQHQQIGIGRRLIQAVVERLRETGINSMLVWVLAANPARRFYEALGGREVGRRQIELGGAVLDEVAYGWPDTTILGPGG